MRAQEFVAEDVSGAEEVLSYVKRMHNDFRLDHAITDHPRWKLSNVPLSSLEVPDPEPGEVEDDPYNRVQWMDMDTVDDITADVVRKYPIVADAQGYIIDGNHRALAARLMGMTHIPAWTPATKVDENFADGKKPGRKGLSKRVGIPRKATLGQLEKIAKSSTGERRRMAQWQLNMRRGRNRAKKSQ